MESVFTINPNCTVEEIDDTIFARVEMSAALSKLVAVTINEGSFCERDKVIVNTLWIIETFIEEVKQLLLHKFLSGRN